MFKSLLVANRGEIACRVIRAAKALGVRTIAVYSDADRGALHTRLADEAIHVGPAPSSQSYLVVDNILAAAKESGAQAIHPGYGFLSENADFARAVQAAGIVWVGPPPEAMDRMGDKTQARAEAEAAGVPVAPGSPALADAQDAATWASKVGYPVMLKAAAGGGGMGMRVVHDASVIQAEFKACQDQARSAFGVPDVFLEKFIQRPRHIEVQILADGHGNCIHLYERECSIQRRHQKLVEEAPSPALTQEQRVDIGAKAVELAKRVGYTNAGTMEFLYEDGNFYFNEMNTRIQVEHPVTELVTGVDLVQWQLRIASGEELSIRQSDVALKGHAIELRINAEDPRRDFLPTPGPVHRLRLPVGDGIRVDHGLIEGWTVPDCYDSMVLKLLAHGPTRREAIDRVLRATGQLDVDGVGVNTVWHQALLQDEAFLAGDLSTRFLEERDILRLDPGPDARRRAAAVVAALVNAPGAGLAGLHARQARPPMVQRSSGERTWEVA